jgi:hypothetical protein
MSKTAGFAGLANCGGEKPHKGRSRAKPTPDCGFAEPEPPRLRKNSQRSLKDDIIIP